ncbi:MAG: HD domain-containing phosphohydrolase [Candidatus Omnitrophota bacterium]
MNENINILIINKDETIVKTIKQALMILNCQIKSENHFWSGINLIRKISFDVIIIQWSTEELTGIDMVRAIKEVDPDSIIIALVENLSPDVFSEIYRAEIYDYLNLPVDFNHLVFIIKKAIEARNITVHSHKADRALSEQNMSLQKQNILLAKRIEDSTKNLSRLYDDLRQTYLRTVNAFAQAIEARDHFTSSHSEKVSKYALLIAEELNLPAKEIEIIKEACQLHDLGKIGISDYILSKPGKLTKEERREVELHTIKAVQILEPLTFLDNTIGLIKHHHERFDGKGYPDGLKGEQIPLGARIICVADSYDAMTSARSYRKTPLSKQEAIEEIKRNSGSQFDPKIVEVFLKVLDKV